LNTDIGWHADDDADCVAASSRTSIRDLRIVIGQGDY
jgi:hypothetical protein